MLFRRERLPSDLPLIVSWVPDAEALNLFTGTLMTWPLTVEQLVAKERSPGYEASAVADEAGALVGHFDLTRTDDRVRLGRVIVHPGRRGTGLASPLVRLAIDRATSLGAAVIELNVVIGNEAAERTYRNHHFIEDAVPERAGLRTMRRSIP